MSTITNKSYTFLNNKGKSTPISPKLQKQAQAIDTNKDFFLSGHEIAEYIEKTDGCGHTHEGPGRSLASHDDQPVVQDFKTFLQGAKIETNDLEGETKFKYLSNDETAEALLKFEEKYPDLCERVSLGKSHEGRDIWALRVSSNIKEKSSHQKTGVVVTGCHHAREWATTQVPLHMAEAALTEYGNTEEGTHRLDNSELWFVPIVNPDGYEFSREEKPFWRKNRRYMEETPCGKLKRPVYGVDLNRNYADGSKENAELYRPDGDEQCNLWDNDRYTSDTPQADTYRGPAGASEPEVQALLKLQLEKPNIDAVLDYHSYGGMILYPWGSSKQPVENVEEYRSVGQKMNEKLDNDYRVMQSVSLYPTYGGSHDIHHANGLFSMTMEIGNRFHQRESELPDIVKPNVEAGLVFIDEAIKRDDDPAN